MSVGKVTRAVNAVTEEDPVCFEVLRRTNLSSDTLAEVIDAITVFFCSVKIEFAGGVKTGMLLIASIFESHRIMVGTEEIV